MHPSFTPLSPLFHASFRHTHNFVRALRTRSHLNRFAPVVVVHEDPDPDPDEIEVLSMFPQVYCMQGCPLKLEDLVRVQASKATAAVITTGGANYGPQAAGVKADTYTILARHLLRTVNAKCRITVQLEDENNLEFCRDAWIEHSFGRTAKEALMAAHTGFSYGKLEPILTSYIYQPANEFIFGSLVGDGGYTTGLAYTEVHHTSPHSATTQTAGTNATMPPPSNTSTTTHIVMPI